MTASGGDSDRPGVYARLAEEAEIRQVTRTPPRAARWLGWAICLALIIGVMVAALQANPW